MADGSAVENRMPFIHQLSSRQEKNQCYQLNQLNQWFRQMAHG